MGDEKLTLRAVVKRLQKLGIQPRKSKRGVWNTSTLSTLLKHEVFIGTTYWGASYAVIPERPYKTEGYKKVKKTSRKMRPKTQWYPIKVPAIIDKDLFDRVGWQLRKNFETLGRNKVNEYLLAGRIYCLCGARRAGEGVQRGKHLYYRCENRVHTFPLPPTCAEPGINAKIADVLLWKNIEELFKSPELLSKQIERFRKNRPNRMPHGSTIDINSTKKEITRLQVQEDRFASAYSKEIISLEKFEEYVAPVREKIRMFENQIAKARLEENPPEETKLPNENEVEAFAKESVQFIQNLNFQAKQDIIRRTVDKVMGNGKELQVYGTIRLSQIYVVFYPEYSSGSNSIGQTITNSNVVFSTKYRNRRFAECGEVHIV